MKRTIVAIGCAALLVTFILACADTKTGGTSSSDKTTPAKTAGKVDIVSHTGAANEIGTYQIDGEVVNNTGVKVTFVKVTATFYDAAGKVIDTSFTFTDPIDLEISAKAPFKIYASKSDITASVAKYDLATSYQ